MSLFGAPEPSSSEEWGELVCDVIEGLQTCDSVIQNSCRMQGRCVFGGIRSTACLGESNHLHSLTLSQ